MKMKVFVISGPSGSGKTSILKELFGRGGIKNNFFKIPTFTTRRPRKGEKDGIDYRFLTKKLFLELKRKGYFLETKKYLDDFYATPKDFLKQSSRLNKYPFLCIDVEGALKIKEKFKHKAVLIFIFPPSEKVLQSRLKKRRTEEAGILKKRLRIAKKEVKYAEKYQYRLINKSLKQTVDSLEEILTKEILLSRAER